MLTGVAARLDTRRKVFAPKEKASYATEERRDDVLSIDHIACVSNDASIYTRRDPFIGALLVHRARKVSIKVFYLLLPPRRRAEM